MIYITNLEKVNEGKYTIGIIHYRPFDNNYGLGKTEGQLREEGRLVELPQKLPYLEGKDQVMYYSPLENKCFWEYVDIPTIQENFLEELDNQMNYNLDLDFRLSKIELGLGGM